jgi:hypothetical protein
MVCVLPSPSNNPNKLSSSKHSHCQSETNDPVDWFLSSRIITHNPTLDLDSSSRIDLKLKVNRSLEMDKAMYPSESVHPFKEQYRPLEFR